MVQRSKLPPVICYADKERRNTLRHGIYRMNSLPIVPVEIPFKHEVTVPHNKQASDLTVDISFDAGS